MKETFKTMQLSSSFSRVGDGKAYRTLMPTPSPIMSAYHVPPLSHYNYNDQLPTATGRSHASVQLQGYRGLPGYTSDNYIPPLPSPVTPIGVQSRYRVSHSHFSSNSSGQPDCAMDDYVPPLPPPITSVGAGSRYQDVLHSTNSSGSSGPPDYASDDYVPPLPPPVTPVESNDIDEDDGKLFGDKDFVELDSTTTDDDSFGSANAYVTRAPLKHQNGQRKDEKVKKMEEKIYPITEMFNPLFLEEKRKESISRPNFATIMVRNFFKKGVRITSNVAGKCGKNQLNKEMMAAIKVATFRMWPLKVSEEEKVAWRQCTKAIDEANRRLYRSRNPSVKENTT